MLEQETGVFCLNWLTYLYWFKIQEIVTLLKEIGFKIIEIKTVQMIKKNICNFTPTGGRLYIVCKK